MYSKFKDVARIILIALSCFVPLYLTFIISLLFKLMTEGFGPSIFERRFNWLELIVFGVLCFLGLLGFRIFLSHLNHKGQVSASESVIIKDAENITADYYFTYFSLFVLTFATVSIEVPAQFCNTIILHILLILVYVKNQMFFINPLINIWGYKSFKITFAKKNNPDVLMTIKVFTKENLEQRQDKAFRVAYSDSNFSVCYKENKCNSLQE